MCVFSVHSSVFTRVQNFDSDLMLLLLLLEPISLFYTSFSFSWFFCPHTFIRTLFFLFNYSCHTKLHRNFSNVISFTIRWHRFVHHHNKKERSVFSLFLLKKFNCSNLARFFCLISSEFPIYFQSKRNAYQRCTQNQVSLQSNFEKPYQTFKKKNILWSI